MRDCDEHSEAIAHTVVISQGEENKKAMWNGRDLHTILAYPPFGAIIRGITSLGVLPGA